MKATPHLLAAAALLAAFTATHAAQNNGGNPPMTSAPTHTVPAAPQKLVIKTKSTPHRGEAPASTKPIEERKVPQPGCGPTRPGDPKTSTC